MNMQFNNTNRCQMLVSPAKVEYHERHANTGVDISGIARKLRAARSVRAFPSKGVPFAIEIDCNLRTAFLESLGVTAIQSVPAENAGAAIPDKSRLKQGGHGRRLVASDELVPLRSLPLSGSRHRSSMTIRVFSTLPRAVQVCFGAPGRQPSQLAGASNILASSGRIVGASLLGQKRFADAEPLLLSAYDGLTQRAAKIDPTHKSALTDAARRIVNLYNATGGPEQVAECEKRLESSS